jgi:hypothetical protein
VNAVIAAANNAACQGYLIANKNDPTGTVASDGTEPPANCTMDVSASLPNDWKVLVNQAISSNVCNQPGDGGKCNPLAH